MVITKDKDQAQKGGSSIGWHVWLLTFCGGLGGFLFGYDTGVISGAIPFMEDDLLAAYKTDVQAMHIRKEWIVSVALLGAVLGSMIGGYASDVMGRKKVLMIGDVFFTTGSIVMAASHNLSSMILGRVLVGLGVGLASVTVPVYIAECSPVQQRAMLVTVNVLMITCGQFCSYVMNYAFTYVSGTWRWMLGAAAIPALGQLASIPFLPESPKWLHSKGFRAQANKISVQLGLDEVSITAQPEKDFSFQRLLQPEVRYEISLGMALQVLQQFCGINTVMYYTPTILQMAGYVDRRQALLVSLLPALVNSLGTIIGMWCVERVGRRKLLLSSMMAVAVSLVLLGQAFSWQNSQQNVIHTSPVVPGSICSTAENCQTCLKVGCTFCPSEDFAVGMCLDADSLKPNSETCIGPTTNPDASKCPSNGHEYVLILILLYLASFSPGLGPVPWAVNAEIYPLEVRGVGNGMAATANWVANFIISQGFLSAVDWIGAAGFFWICALIAASGAAAMFLFLPETKGLTLEEIQKVFRNRANTSVMFLHGNDHSSRTFTSYTKL